MAKNKIKSYHQLNKTTIMSKRNNIKSTYAKLEGCNVNDVISKKHPDSIKKESIIVNQKKIRGVNGNRSLDESKMKQSNPQTIEVASLESYFDTLVVSFELKIKDKIDILAISDNPEIQSKLSMLIREYINEYGMTEIASRIAYNLVSSRFLYNNRDDCTKLYTYIIDITNSDNEKLWNFDSYHLEMDSIKFESDDELENKNFQSLVESIAAVLEGKTRISAYKVYSFAYVGNSAIVHPSQIFSQKQQNTKDDENSNPKLLEKFSDGTARLTPGKIDHAIRTFDTWYDSDNESVPPISVEVYGQNTFTGEVKRGNNNDFYTLLDRWLNNDDDLTLSDKHYIVSKIIFGFVMG